MRSGSVELPDDVALFTDLYELTMAASYFAEGMFAPASFSFFVRRLPPGRGYLVAAGFETVARYLEAFRFASSGLEYLQSTGLFTPAFLAFLRTVRFTGDVDAVRDGAVCFADEPLLEVTAPLIEAQLVETFIINQLNLQTMLATKAARTVDAARGRPVVDFSLRRAQGTDAGMQIARCSYLAGAAGTSNVLAGKRWGIPTFGTMAHSYVQAFASETAAFQAFARSFPRASTFLVDTYDTAAGVRAAVPVALAMRRAGTPLRAIRLDSGDLAALAREARRILDVAGLTEVEIFASGGLDEYAVDDLLIAGAPLDAFGVGTQMGVSGDAPWLDCAYKLVAYDGVPRVKLSPDKATWAGCKQTWRAGAGGRALADCLALRGESRAAAAAALGMEAAAVAPQLQPLLRHGRLCAPPPSLADSREYCRAQLAALDGAVRDLRVPVAYPLLHSPALLAAQERAAAAARARAS